ncbi:4-hydroxy-tetrahydrodipicolinate synthase [bacterium]|nr:4-hydroxy-tetrahydrodipicolinate synthase [bacterium]
MFKGIYTAIITPFHKGQFDERTFRNLIERQIQEGIHGIVVCGTTGEATTLSDDEYTHVIQTCVDQTASRVPVIAGAGSNCTEKAIKLTKAAFRTGIQATLQVTPYYNKPTQEGLYQHFKTVAKSADLPVVLYNVPGRTGVNMLPETVGRLAEIDNIIGLKEASGDIKQIKKIKKLVDDDFAILSGDDPINLQIYEAGGVGAISVASNVMPAKVCKVWNSFLSGDIKTAKITHEELINLTKALFIESNPIPTKTALSLMGLCEDEFRLPLTKMGDRNKEELIRVLKQYKLI